MPYESVKIQGETMQCLEKLQNLKHYTADFTGLRRVGRRKACLFKKEHGSVRDLGLSDPRSMSSYDSFYMICICFCTLLLFLCLWLCLLAGVCVCVWLGQATSGLVGVVLPGVWPHLKIIIHLELIKPHRGTT